MNAKKVDLATLKDKGFLPLRQENNFSMRLHLIGGRVEAEDLKVIAEAALKYGDGYIHITSRQGIEIPFVKAEDADSIFEEMEEYGLSGGAAGQKVRGEVSWAAGFLRPLPFQWWHLRLCLL
ncbi:MAG: hypothetical protein PHV51_00425, partial [Methanosarcinaceae archaeon]|nr:hypothetical protein [Methanosarcinaceae archaeon]